MLENEFNSDKNIENWIIDIVIDIADRSNFFVVPYERGID